MTVQELIKASLRLIGAIATGETPTDAELQDGMSALNLLIKGWSNKAHLVYYETEDTHTLVSGTSQYTIGSGATINTTRPIKIIRAFVQVGNIDYPLDIIGEQQYREIGIKTYSATPGWLYYNPGYANGEINLYPAGSGTLYLYSKKVLTTYTALTTSISEPEGLERAMKYNLAIELAPEYGVEPSGAVIKVAEESRADIEALNASNQVQPVKIEMFRLSRRWHINEG
jgi:hypothetical protein